MVGEVAYEFHPISDGSVPAAALFAASGRAGPDLVVGASRSPPTIKVERYGHAIASSDWTRQ
jgi:hypothetical protein